LKPRCLILLGALVAASAALLFACGSTSSHESSTADDDVAAETVWTDTTSGLAWQSGAAVGTIPYLGENAQSYCAGLTWAGESGWRLPTITELRSLVRGCPATDAGDSCGVTNSCAQSNCWSNTCFGCTNYLGGPGPGGAYWPAELTGFVGASGYWSSTAVTDSPNALWVVNFFYGGVGNLSDIINGCVRCVR